MEKPTERSHREYSDQQNGGEVQGPVSASEKFDALWQIHADEMARGIYRPFSEACRADPALEGELVRRWMARLPVNP